MPEGDNPFSNETRNSNMMGVRQKIEMNLRNIFLIGVGAFMLAAPPQLSASMPIIGDTATAHQWMDQGNAFAKNGDWKSAKVAFTNALEACDYDQPRIALARADYALGDYQDAAAFYKILVEHEPDIEMQGITEIDVRTEYAIDLQRLGDVQGALTSYNAAVGVVRARYRQSKETIDLPTFRSDGSNYDPVLMEGMAHVIKALAWHGYNAKVLSEARTALAVAPNSAVVYGYAQPLVEKAIADAASEAKQLAQLRASQAAPAGAATPIAK
jgi:tetratricopeptide (TPR) repeat protein